MTPLAQFCLGAAAALTAEWAARAAWGVRQSRATVARNRAARQLAADQDQAIALTEPPALDCALCGYNPRHVTSYTGWVRILETCPAHQTKETCQ